MVFNNNNNTTITATRWKEDDSSKWTEVVSKKKQYQQQQQQQQQTEGRDSADDPFAGMKSCVDYEQEIERLKQLVPKVPTDSQHKKRPSLEKKFNTNNTTTTITSNTTTTTSNHTNNNHNFYNNEFINTNNTTSTITSPTPTTSAISRSNSPDTTHSSDSDVSSLLSDQIVTEEEKLRFLAFVRSWTGDWRKGAMMDDLTSSSNSLWADQSPWSRRHNVQSQQYYSYQQPTTMLNKHGQQPIGMGRKNHHQSFGYAL